MASWYNEREDARYYASEFLGIPFHLVEDAKAETGWTWAQVADRLADQVEAKRDFDDGYDVSDLYDEELPDIFNYYHGASSD